MKRLLTSLLLCVLPSLALANSGLAQPSAQALLQMSHNFEEELLNNILPYWIKNAPNPATGGFYGEVAADGKANPQAARGALMSSRLLWTYSAAYEGYRAEPLRKMADMAYKDLEKNFWDRKHGGLYWSVTATGSPEQKHKQIYGQVFGIYGYVEYFRATGEKVALERAQELFQLIEKHAFDKKNGGYIEALNEDWSPLSTLSTTLGVKTVKSQNTHLHIMEAYANLLRAWPDDTLRTQLTALVNTMLTKVLNAKTNHLALYMDADWKVQGDEISFGHDIEASWLLVDAAQALGDPALLKRTRTLAIAMVDTVLAEGIDTDGALYNEASASKGITQSEKDWWPQAEALVGLINAYQITGDDKYLFATMRTWGFIQAHLINSKTGEWHWGTDKHGKVIVKPTLSMWKSSYHNSRAMMQAIERMGLLAAHR